MANFSVETIGKLMASGRNYISTAVGFIGGVGIVSAANSKGMMDAINEIFTGLGMVFSGATSLWNVLLVAFPIIGVAMAKMASNSAKVDNQAASLKASIADPNTPVSTEAKAAVLDAALALPEVPNNQTIKVSDPALANITSTNVVLAR